MPGNLVCWPAYPFRPGPPPRAAQASLQSRPRGVPFSLLDRQGQRLWWFIPTREQIECLVQAVAVADISNPPWTEIYTQLSHQGLSATEIEKLDMNAVLDLLPRAPASGHRGGQAAGRMDRHGAAALESNAPPDVDWPAALAQLKGNKALLREITEAFLSEAGGMVERVRLAIKSGDAAELRCAAEAMKEAVEYFHAQRSYELAAQLEAIGHEGKLDKATDVYRRLKATVGQVIRELKAATDGRKP